jgi:uncharacterized protein YcnI
MLEGALPCRIFVQYVKRCSTLVAILVDKVSRGSTTTQLELGENCSFANLFPKAGWQIGFKIQNLVGIYPNNS